MHVVPLPAHTRPSTFVREGVPSLRNCAISDSFPRSMGASNCLLIPYGNPRCSGCYQPASDGRMAKHHAYCLDRIKQRGAREMSRQRLDRAGASLRIPVQVGPHPTASTMPAQRCRAAEATGASVRQHSRVIISMSQMEMEGAGEISRRSRRGRGTVGIWMARTCRCTRPRSSFQCAEL